MTTAARTSPADGPSAPPSPSPLLRLPDLLRRTVPAGLLLLAAYLALGLLTDAGGYLGTDTGGKVATLEAMSRAGAFDPDVGYWAADLDPEGDMHPLYYTERLGDRYVNVTTLPMLVLAWPLYEAGGYHAAVAVAAIGAVAAAFAARALADRLGAVDGWDAFWAVGLATPVAVYALDLWEHAPGLALMAWAVVAVVDVVEARRPWWAGALAGAAFGTAATMRTEALLYGAVFVGAGLVVALVRRRDVRAVVGIGAAALTGVAVPLLVNHLAERVVYGGEALRAGRTGDALTGGGTRLGTRSSEGLVTTFGVSSASSWVAPVAVGVVVVGLVMAAVVAAERGRRGPAMMALLAGGLLTVSAAFAGGLGFVPGLLVASPLAAAGVLGVRGGRGQWLAISALAVLPAVWLFQFVGGAGPQWGGRYQLLSGFVLAVVGLGVARRAARPVALGVVVFGAVITAAGVAWTIQRSHLVADAFQQLVERDDPLLISRTSFFLREGGPAALDERWLTVSTSPQLRAAVDWASEQGLDRVVVLTVGDDPPPTIRGWTATTVEEIPLFTGDPIVLQTFVPDHP